MKALGNRPPRRQFHHLIQSTRGLHSHNDSLNKGADYWVSSKGHGVYPFHSVSTDAANHYIVSKRANSHSCIRLSISDAKWTYENIKKIRRSYPVIIRSTPEA
ncbi:L,D-transpeptidase family protein [Lactiplantibacillus argentoratensis]|uniref:L,D-transpeptidase family protein n=1 Tax=Lactiplantibacillus argentoratensis TaxID=271881 RepID=UPI001E42887B|nr:L,D-transpeptidase [Lactiplantibacillus argentoratensis]